MGIESQNVFFVFLSFLMVKFPATRWISFFFFLRNLARFHKSNW